MSAISSKIEAFQFRFSSKQFAFTVNPSDVFQHIGDARLTLSDRFREVKTHVKTTIHNIMSLNTTTGIPFVRSVVLYPDISFPEDICILPARRGQKRITKAPRVHWHGAIILSDEGAAELPEFLHQISFAVFNKGMVNIDTMEDITEWIEYSKKFVTMYPRYRKFKITALNTIEPCDSDDEEDTT